MRISKSEFRMSSWVLCIALSLASLHQAYADDCLNLQKIGEAAATLENLEVRSDVTDIEGIETALKEGNLSEKYLASFLADNIDQTET